MWPPTEAENIDVLFFVTIGMLQTCEFGKGTFASLVLESVGLLLEYTVYFLKRLGTDVKAESVILFLTSSLTKYVFYNWLINNILYLCVT